MFVAGATSEAEIRSLFDERLKGWGSDARGKVRSCFLGLVAFVEIN